MSQKQDNSTSPSQTTYKKKRRKSPAQKKRDKERLKKWRMKRALSKSHSGTDSVPVDTPVDVQQHVDLKISDSAACKIVSRDTPDTVISSQETCT